MEKEIQKTENLNIFKKYDFNRVINKKSLKELVDAIKEENALHLHPILVTSDFFVIDGQHRLEAAKKLNLPIYFIQDDSSSRKHVMNSNIHQRTWNITDVLKYYAVAENKIDYKEMLDLLKSLNLRPKGLLGLLFGFQNNVLIEQIKKGRFFLPENKILMNKSVDFYKELILFIEDRRITPRSMFSSSNFTQALRRIVSNETFDKDLFFKKLENKWFDLKPQLNSKEWYKLLISIYNWKNRNIINEED